MYNIVQNVVLAGHWRNWSAGGVLARIRDRRKKRNVGQRFATFGTGLRKERPSSIRELCESLCRPSGAELVDASFGGGAELFVL
ncbi:hypothetical protein AVEN_88997-1 [Araneus ventricosus]|uniref:Uncharacterized protein n=1 Tax=Araneus ventricosus TaxID=182803 RepID=A0A4Y2DIP7_ARAVE|nr:hypothetical protein AVEN_88997-1 [Araneus ventricosus]